MPTALRPSAVAGARLPALAAQVGAVAADNSVGVADVLITGVTLRGQDVRPGDLFAALPGAISHGAPNTFELNHDWRPAAVFGLTALFVLCLFVVIGGQNSPFLYFQF